MAIEDRSDGTGYHVITEAESLMAHLDLVSHGYAQNYVDTMEGSLTEKGLRYGAQLLLAMPPMERKLVIECVKLMKFV